MNVLEVEGRTVDDATKKALAELGIKDTSKVKIEVVDEGKSGIFGFGVSRQAKIRIYFNENDMDTVNSAKEIFLNILKRMGIEVEIKDVKEGSNRIYMELESDQSGLIIGKQGKTLEALQFLLNLIVSNKTGSEKKIILDIESYREKREKALRRLSKDIAHKVIRTGKPCTLEPMNPFERRLIHLTLQNDSRVSTKSEGEGIYRKVKVSPSNSR
ncbi:MAG: protein jag [Spirochaetes bacterium]|nr:protein jag [Spirochaetota bacterium]